MDDQDPEPITVFNTSFSAYRASTLHTAAPLTDARLAALSRRLRDTLVGDVVRGIHVTAVTDEALARAGPLERVSLRFAAATELLDVPAGGENEEEEAAEEEEGGYTGRRGLVLELKYENARGEAVFLPRVGAAARDSAASKDAGWDTWMASAEAMADADVDDKFLELPLVLLRLPAPLKPVIINFFQGVFDCRIVPLRLDATTLIGIWEGWIASAPLQGPAVKDFVLTLSFSLPRDEGGGDDGGNDAPAPQQPDCGLRALDIVVAADDLRKFVRAGKAADAAAPGKTGSGDRLYGLFTRALADYVKAHMALDMFHPAVSVSKIACGGFVLSDGRCKVFSPSDSFAPLWSRSVVEALIKKAVA